MEKQMHGFRARLDYWLKHNYAFYKLFNVTKEEQKIIEDTIK